MVNDSNSQYPISLTVLAYSNITNVYHSLEDSPIADEPGYLAIFKHKIEKNELSPEKKVCFDAALDDTIYKCCNTFSATHMAEKTVRNTIQNALSLTAGVVPTNAVIHNVGQGNNVLIELSNGRKFFYDLGMTMDKDERNDPYIQQSIRQFRTISSDIVVLSHWDLDHILGISYADDSIYNAL